MWERFGRHAIQLLYCAFLVIAVTVSGEMDKGLGKPLFAQTLEVPGSVVLLKELRQAVVSGNLKEAEELARRIIGESSCPLHHRQEAEELLRGLLSADEPQSAVPGVPEPFSRPFQPALEFYVSPSGLAEGDGTAARPWKDLAQARDAIRQLKSEHGLPRGGVAVTIRGGRYEVRETFRLEAIDSGTAECPIVYRAATGEKPVFSGGVMLRGFEKTHDPAVLRRVPESARGHIYQVSLKSLGIEQVPPLVLGGFASGRGFRTHPVVELFWNGIPLTLARWPNQGFVWVEKVSDENPITSHGRKGSAAGVIYFSDPRLKSWSEEPDGWLYGYWFWDWADSYERIAAVDPATGEIRLQAPYHRYGYHVGQPFFALNMLCELDQPGEWYLDRQKLILYVYPPNDPNQATAELSFFGSPFVVLDGAEHVRFENLTWELGMADGLHIRGGKHCLIAGCIVRRFAGDGIVIRRGIGHGVLSCNIYSLGRGGIVMDCGERRTLIPGESFVQNCHIYQLSRVDHTYTPGVLLNGVGNRLAYNWVHDVGSSAFRVEGNDHLIEWNEVCRVVMESDDQGGVDMFGNPTYRGVIYRFNYWHHIGGWENPMKTPPLGRAGIRLDDAISGVLVYGNVFYHASSGAIGFGGVQVHGGKENIIDNNLFVDCMAAISFSPWSESRWKQFVTGWLEKGDVDRATYLQKYPELSRLEELPNANWIYRNVVLRCGQFFLRDHKRNCVAQNLVSSELKGVMMHEPGTFQIKADDPELLAIGFRPIPFERIGLYPDQYRQKVPYEAVRRGRKGEDPAEGLPLDH